MGAVYVADDNERLHLTGSYAFQRRKGISSILEPGEGLVGQAALEKKTIQISRIPDDYMSIHSGLGESPPRAIIVVPLIYKHRIEGVAELGFFDDPDDAIRAFLVQAAEPMALSLQVARNQKTMKELLVKTQAQAEELRAREEELRENNALLPNTAKDMARLACEKFRKKLADHIFQTGDVQFHITASSGVVGFDRKETSDILLERVGRALCRAKRAGCDCVVVV